MRFARRALAAWQTLRYNRDWVRYVWATVAGPGDDTLLTFRLRNQQTITLRRSVRATLNEIYLHRVYDVPGVDLSTCSQVFDFGANMGVFALYVAAIAPAASIACFEPASANFAILDQNLTSNHARARAYQMAVSTTCGPRRLSLAGHAGQYSLNFTGEAFEIVECVDLDRVFSLTGVTVCDFLKMDVEGEELAILLNAPLGLLQRIRAMSIEWHHPIECLAQVQSRLEAAGFRSMTTTVGDAQQQVMLKAWQT